jgi:hypothetical protein
MYDLSVAKEFLASQSGKYSTLENNAEIIWLLSAFSFITSGLNVNMLYWCFSYGTGDGIVNVGSYIGSKC